MDYKYTAYYTPENRIIRGVISVASEEAAVEHLKRSGLNILSLKKTRKLSVKGALSSLLNLRTQDIILFCRQLAMLLERGVPFLIALKLAQEQVNNRSFKKLLSLIIHDVEAGSTFSSAVAKYPKTFSLTFTSMMRVGEESGKLEIVLREMASHMERDMESSKKIKSALVYPVMILLMGIITVVVLLTTVLPSMMRVFAQFNADLPWPSRVTQGLASFIVDYGLYILGGIVVLIIITIWLLQRPSGRYFMEKLILRLPGVGRIRLLRNLTMFSRIMSILLSSALPLTQVIEVAHQSIQSEMVRRELARISDSLIRGQGISHSMKESKLFPSMLIQMVITGEETNSLDSSFAALTEHYDFEFNQCMDMFISMVEPMLILIVGLIIGFIAISAMMPIYSIYDILN